MVRFFVRSNDGGWFLLLLLVVTATSTRTDVRTNDVRPKRVYHASYETTECQQLENAQRNVALVAERLLCDLH